MLGTAVEIMAVGGEEAEGAIAQGFAEISRIQEKMAWQNPNSDISRINNSAGGRPLNIGQEMFGFLERSLDLCYKTGGAFNIAVGPLSRLWDFDGETGFVPIAEEIGRRLAWTDYKKIVLDDKNRSVALLYSGMSLDLGGIAKGYAVDRAVEVLKSSGISAGVVNAGGDMRLFGPKPADKLWHIGIQHPRKTDEVLATFRITDRAVVTSGDYERFFIKDEIRYHHILDPATGYPALGCRSVTVVADTAFLADAMATAVYVLGSVEGAELLKSRKDLEGMIVDTDGPKFITPGLKKSRVREEKD